MVRGDEVIRASSQGASWMPPENVFQARPTGALRKLEPYEQLELILEWTVEPVQSGNSGT